MQQANAKSKMAKGKKTKFIFFTLMFLFAIIFIIAEVLLAVFHYPSTYTKMKSFSLEQAKWWTCDSSNGPRYVAKQLGKTDEDFFKNEKWYYLTVWQHILDRYWNHTSTILPAQAKSFSF